MVAVPTNRAADVKEQLVYEQQNGGDFIGDYFSRMEVSGVQRQSHMVLSGVAQTKLIGAYGIALLADPEQLALYRIQVVAGVDGQAEYLVQGGFHAHTGAHPVYGNVFIAIWKPEIGDAAFI